jgi:hypothetical protein
MTAGKTARLRMGQAGLNQNHQFTRAKSKIENHFFGDSRSYNGLVTFIRA